MLSRMLSAAAMGGGVASALARALGAGDPRRAQSVALHALLIGALAGVLCSPLLLVAQGASAWQMFALSAAAMVLYGSSCALALKLDRWGAAR